MVGTNGVSVCSGPDQSTRRGYSSCTGSFVYCMCCIHNKKPHIDIHAADGQSLKCSVCSSREIIC